MLRITRLWLYLNLLVLSSLLATPLLAQVVLGDTSSTNVKPWRPIPNNTCIFLVPTGFGMEKGESYYQNFSLFFNQVHYGVSNELSLGFTFESLSLFASIDSMKPYSPGFALSPKVAIPLIEDQLSLGLGALLVELPNTAVFMDLGFVTGILTYGKKDRNISMGVGFGLVEGEFSVQPTLLLGGHYRVSRKLVLMTETILIPGPDLFYTSFGLRILGKRLHWDLGWVAVGAATAPTGDLPLIGLVVPFGRR
ncbi:MAG: hypothetical protein R2828_13295 [Saprospiraceae bacterium]